MDNVGYLEVLREMTQREYKMDAMMEALRKLDPREIPPVPTEVMTGGSGPEEVSGIIISLFGVFSFGLLLIALYYYFKHQKNRIGCDTTQEVF